MKTNYWLILGAMLASSAVAQNNTNTLPAMPAPVTTPTAEAAPAMTPAAPESAPAKPAPAKPKKAAPKRAALHEPTIALVPGPAAIAVSNVNVRGQAGLKGEMLAHLFKGDAVTVLGQINLDKHATGEPAQWAKIALPSTVHVWANAKFIDQANKVVSAKKLNFRAGPGENFSVLGVLEKGAPVNVLETKGNWVKIEAPASAYAFVAAMFLKQDAAMLAAAAAPAPAPTPVSEPQPIMTAPINVPPPTPPVENIPATRVVSHEGIVRHVGSPIAPTEYELYDPSTDKNIDFLYPAIGNLDLSQYVNARVIITGEEGLAKRWSDVPVLTVESVQVIEANAVPRVIYRSPRQAQQH